MKQKPAVIVFLLFLFVISISCENNQETNSKYEEALEVINSMEIAEKEKLVRSQILNNEALELDSNNVSAWRLATSISIRMRDSIGLFTSLDKLMELEPEKPYFVGQKALFLHLMGESTESAILYKKAMEKYHEHLITDSQNFDLRMEMMDINRIYGDSIAFQKNILEMRALDYTEDQKKILDLFIEIPNQNKKFLQYWKGEIEIDELENP